MLNRLALCSLTRGLVLRTAQSVQLSARQLRAKQSYNRASLSFVPSPRRGAQQNPSRRKGTDENVGEESLARNDLREHLDEPAVLRLLNRLIHTLTYPSDRRPGS